MPRSRADALDRLRARRHFIDLSALALVPDDRDHQGRSDPEDEHAALEDAQEPFEGAPSSPQREGEAENGQGALDGHMLRLPPHRRRVALVVLWRVSEGSADTSWRDDHDTARRTSGSSPPPRQIVHGHHACFQAATAPGATSQAAPPQPLPAWGPLRQDTSALRAKGPVASVPQHGGSGGARAVDGETPT